MTWDALKKEAKKMGYIEGSIVVNGVVWFTKKGLSFDLSFNNKGEVLLSGDEEYILAKDRTPPQIYQIIKALHWEEE